MWGLSDFLKKSYEAHFFHFQRPLTASSDLWGHDALEILNPSVKSFPKWYVLMRFKEKNCNFFFRVWNFCPTFQRNLLHWNSSSPAPPCPPSPPPSHRARAPIVTASPRGASPVWVSAPAICTPPPPTPLMRLLTSTSGRGLSSPGGGGGSCPRRALRMPSRISGMELCLQRVTQSSWPRPPWRSWWLILLMWMSSRSLESGHMFIVNNTVRIIRRNDDNQQFSILFWCYEWHYNKLN